MSEPARRDVDASQAQGLIIGDHATLHATYHLPAPPVQWPVRVGVIPPLADCLQHRHAEEAVLAAAGSDTVVLTQILSGLGGVGKTQLAAGFAQQRWRDRAVDLLVWVPAGSRTSIVDSYADAAQQLGIAAGTTGEPAANRLLAWLAGTDRRWLVILDDLAVVGDLRGLWPPHSPTGAAVVTTRRRDAALAGHGRSIVPVGLFTPDEARAYLNAKFAGRHHLADDVEGLAADLGYLPLALAQAAAYMLDRNLTCTTYRQRFADRQQSLNDLLPETGALPDDHQAALTATWSLSLERANNLHPPGLAEPVLQTCSLLDANGIPLPLLTTPKTLTWLSQTTTTPVDADMIHDAVRNLHRLNLLTHDPDNPTRRCACTPWCNGPPSSR